MLRGLMRTLTGGKACVKHKHLSRTWQFAKVLVR